MNDPVSEYGLTEEKFPGEALTMPARNESWSPLELVLEAAHPQLARMIIDICVMTQVNAENATPTIVGDSPRLCADPLNSQQDAGADELTEPRSGS